ncbi:unknown [Prevotella sp. CAG:487]|nr:unknown [Prevotella sp. CAG:487]
MGASKSLSGSIILRTEQREQHTMFLKKSKTQDFQTKNMIESTYYYKTRRR